MASCHKGDFSLFDQCWNMMTNSWESAPCQPIICEDLSKKSDYWSYLTPILVSLGLVLTAGLVVFCLFLLIKKVQNSIEVSLGFVLAAALRIQPQTRTPNDVDVESSMVSEVHGSSSGYPTLPTYDEAINA